MKNSFNEMEEANIRSFYNGPSEKKVRRGINGSLGTMRFLGQIADVYVNRMVETMMGMASGPEDEISNNPKTLTRGRDGERSRDDADSLDSSKYPNL